MAETNVDFDYSIGTEDRFALRNWFQNFVEAQNSDEQDKLSSFFSVGLIVEGFKDEAMSKEAFLEFLQQEREQGTMDLIRYVGIKARYKDASYMFSGGFEVLADTLLSYEGSIELEVVKGEEGFSIDYIKFYPRLKVSR